MVRLPRIRIRTLMILIALLAVGTGMAVTLHRRSIRLSALALVYGREANQLELRAEQDPSVDVGPLLDRVHWNDTVANAYRNAAARPWAFDEPDPSKITCQCGYHTKKVFVQ